MAAQGYPGGDSKRVLLEGGADVRIAGVDVIGVERILGCGGDGARGDRGGLIRRSGQAGTQQSNVIHVRIFS